MEAICIGHLKLKQHTLPTMVSGKEGGPRLLLLFRYRVRVLGFEDAAAATAKLHQSCPTLCDP